MTDCVSVCAVLTLNNVWGLERQNLKQFKGLKLVRDTKYRLINIEHKVNCS